MFQRQFIGPNFLSFSFQYVLLKFSSFQIIFSYVFLIPFFFKFKIKFQCANLIRKQFFEIQKYIYIYMII